MNNPFRTDPEIAQVVANCFFSEPRNGGNHNPFSFAAFVREQGLSTKVYNSTLWHANRRRKRIVMALRCKPREVIQ